MKEMNVFTKTLNVDLFTKTLDHIETLEAFKSEGVELDDAWYQGEWYSPTRNDQGEICGTQACFAGWACVLAGDQLVIEQVSVEVQQCGDEDCCVCGVIHTEDWPFAVDAAGQRHDIDERAQELLGISPQRARHLFAHNNSLDTLRKRVRNAIVQFESLKKAS